MPTTLERAMNTTMLDRLNLFLAAHASTKRAFFLGDWLQSLDEAAFSELRWMTDKFNSTVDCLPEFDDDLVKLVMELVRAELRTSTLEFDVPMVMGWVGALTVGLSIERLRRNGFVRLTAPISTRPEVQSSLKFTLEGRRQAEKLAKRRH